MDFKNKNSDMVSIKKSTLLALATSLKKMEICKNDYFDLFECAKIQFHEMQSEANLNILARNE